MDYTSGPYSVTFPAGMTSAPLNIAIHDDNIFDIFNRYFYLNINLSLPTGVIAGYPDQMSVAIVDCKL